MSRNEERLNIKEVIMHPNFDDETAENDIAVIKVEGSFNCSSDKIYPACLPNTEVSPDTPPHIRLIYHVRDTPTLAGRTPSSLAGGECLLHLNHMSGLQSCSGPDSLRYQTPLAMMVTATAFIMT